MLWALNDLTIVGSWCYWRVRLARIAAQIVGGRPARRARRDGYRHGRMERRMGFERLTSGAAEEMKVLISTST